MSTQPDHDDDLAWLLLCGGPALRERGTIAGTISVLEAGGPVEGGNLDAAGAYVHPYTDQQIGMGRALVSDVERHRWLLGAWFACSEQARGLLMLRHMAPRAEARSDAGYGARDRWVEGSDHREGEHGLTRRGTETHLGVLAAVALALCPRADDLLVACHDPEPLHREGKRKGTINREEAARRRRVIRDAKQRAEEALAPAWAEWWESKAGADPARKPRERRAVLPAHIPAEATAE